ncbi:TetR family transcriptional regulator [Streptomyces tateyamensis]|uniref:TetR family transcriptional regulator n=1 Tax=Streptomyces tateyamensis TaxID=565073 RepID=A0A2V4NRP4_9ACTN|nr:ScbR family autoregulator-binding transcription factor [Streptomyces tateyamensis]PYC83768.1 TetR family transcriptional regulator [Streptomyces tateyamensis]
MAQQERAIRTRRAILEAAATVFAERGYAAATIAEILAQAGVTKGALYFHFGSKEELARGVLSAQVSGGRPVPQASKLQEWVDVGLVLAHRLPRDPILQAGARLTLEPEVRELLGEEGGTAWAAWAEVSAGMLAEAQRRGEVLPHVNPKETAELMVGTWTGVQLVSQFSSGWADLEMRIAALFRHFLPAIAVPAILGHLDTSPERGARLVAEADQQVADQG